MTYQDPDPTPPNGTPRPTPCAALRCDLFAPSPARYCSKHQDTLGPYPTLVEFAEAWLNDTADGHHPADRLALEFFEQALNTLYGFAHANRLGDAVWANNCAETAYRLLGWVKCDTCGEVTGGEEIDVNGMCPDCVDEAANAL